MGNRFIIVDGENYDEALEKAMLQLKLTRDEVAVEILEEKRGFLFKKGSIKLKVSPKEAEAVVTMEAIEAKEEAPLDLIKGLKSIEAEVKPYQLSYGQEGVFLRVNNTYQNDQDLINAILDYLKRKQVKGYELNQVTQAVKQKNQPCKIAPPQEESLIDSTVKINLSRDKMEASIWVSAAEGGKEFTLETLKEELFQGQVVFGIDEELLKKIVDHKWTDGYVKVAKGKAPIDGIDGKAIYLFDTDKSFKPIILEDGTVDFKQLNIIRNVNRGELLVEIIPPTDGVPGTDVCGNTISAKKGKEVRIKKGKNTVESEDGLKLYAAVDGQIIVEDGKISVSEVYQIRGDVDNSTGNVQFNGTVIVNGNVKSGFMIQAEGNIEVNGVVEGATLISKGNIVLSRGIQGNNQALLECGGNLVVKYVENAKIRCRGNIQADFILHSDVVTKGKILLNGKRGLVAGGDIRAGEEIRAKTVGSHMGTSTRLEVGIDPQERMKQDEIKTELAEIDKNSQNLKKTIDLLKRTAQTGQIPKNKEEILIKSVKTLEFLKEKEATLRAQLQEIDERIAYLSRGKIHVSDTIYPGVKVVILNATRFIYDELSNCTLYRKDGEVTIGPYEK